MTDDADILFALDDGVLNITLNRPDAANAVTLEQRRQLGDWLERANEDHSIRCVVIGATGKFFCTGADLRAERDEAARPEGAPEKIVGDVRRGMLRGAIRTVNMILDCEKPVVAKVQGTAAGIGCHLAFACDLIVCSEEARFIELFIRRGLVADAGGTYLLSRTLGPHQVKELLFLGDDLSAADAHRLGLVNRLVPHAEVRSAALALAERLAASPTIAIGVMKGLANNVYGQTRDAAFRDEANACEVNSRSEDFAEGTRAYVERRDPVWRGR
jgi:2-(1,2-epoxy-1,2-dihydrophenyl)acetyl-CoA isomerase